MFSPGCPTNKRKSQSWKQSPVAGEGSSRKRRIDHMVPWNIGSLSGQAPRNYTQTELDQENVSPNINAPPTTGMPVTHSSSSQSRLNDRTDFQVYEAEGYLDLGDATYSCKVCQAIFWYDERADKVSSPSNPDFSLCCLKGKIALPHLTRCPDVLLKLIDGHDLRSKQFVDNIRSYNSMFAFTSLGGKIETRMNNGGGPPQFVISGQNYHRIGTLVPTDGDPPKFAQLYVYDTENELSNRLAIFSSHDSAKGVENTLVRDLTIMIDQHNVLAKCFRRVRDYVGGSAISNFSIRLFRHRKQDPRTYNLPMVDEVAALIVGDFDSSDCGHDIIVRGQGGDFQRIHETHVLYLPLQYPLLFPYGEDGYSENIQFGGSDDDNRMWKRKRVSLREFLSFRVQERVHEKSIMLKSRRLFQQFVVDCYSMVETQRLSFIRNNQVKIRQDFLSGIQEAVDRGDVNPSCVGSRIVLPGSFVGGRRYMFNNCQDAMAICKHFGYPDLFITLACNPKWPEIQRFLAPRQLKPQDRPDIICRVFRIKLDSLMKDLKKGDIFGKVVAGMYSIEFQKRGLPHAHILLWLEAQHKINTVDKIDSVICAELPDPVKYPTLFTVVSSYMVHGPCGIARKDSPCMQKGKCSKYFPKPYVDRTSIDGDGYPIYRRRNTGVTTLRSGVHLDNRFVVPYNPRLLMRYQAHINIECCNKSNSIKYLFKYISKGVDRVTVSLRERDAQCNQQDDVDEIKQYYDCRYLSPCESAWRIFAFDIHYRWPSVQKVTFHLPEDQVVVFRDTETIDNVLHKSRMRNTMFLAWMAANAKYAEARELTYAEFPSMFIFDADRGEWRPRQRGFSIGRMNYIPQGTFREACGALGLLDDDKEFVDGIMEAAQTSSAFSLRKLFVTLLMSNTMSKPSFVWQQTWQQLADDILYTKRRSLNCPDLVIAPEQLQDMCLAEIQKLLLANGKSLRDFDSMPFPTSASFQQYENVLLFNELNFDVDEMLQSHAQCVTRLNPGQRRIYDKVIDAVNRQEGGFFFVYGHGGTGKTFLWKTLTFKVRSEKKIVLNVASSGIASLLLPNGRTTHSQFLIPLSLNEDSCCSIKQGSPKAELLQRTSLIIWDEAPMVNKWAFEALDRTLKDIMRFTIPDSHNKPFGGKVIVLGGDFRQILPVIPKGNRADIVMATVNSSYLWKFCDVLRLTENMRLRANDSSVANEAIRDFAKWVLALGDGTLGDLLDGESVIDIPDQFLLSNKVNAIEEIVNFTYPNIQAQHGSFSFFQDKAILAPTLDVVDTINQHVMSMVPGDEKTYLSCDSIWKVDENTGVEADWLTTEFLNSIRCSGMPDHKLVLKKGVPVMLMRNIDMSSGLCNGTRLIVVELGANVIGAKVVRGDNSEEVVYIPRMNLVPSDNLTPIKFQRRQFPLCVSFAMTINKSQGQTLGRVGIYLPRPVFSHGQLYVAVSRVKCPSGLKIVISDENNIPLSTTKNVVYTEVFHKI